MAEKGSPVGSVIVQRPYNPYPPPPLLSSSLVLAILLLSRTSKPTESHAGQMTQLKACLHLHSTSLLAYTYHMEYNAMLEMHFFWMWVCVPGVLAWFCESKRTRGRKEECTYVCACVQEREVASHATQSTASQNVHTGVRGSWLVAPPLALAPPPAFCSTMIRNGDGEKGGWSSEKREKKRGRGSKQATTVAQDSHCTCSLHIFQLIKQNVKYSTVHRKIYYGYNMQPICLHVCS